MVFLVYSIQHAESLENNTAEVYELERQFELIHAMRCNIHHYREMYIYM